MFVCSVYCCDCIMIHNMTDQTTPSDSNSIEIIFCRLRLTLVWTSSRQDTIVNINLYTEIWKYRLGAAQRLSPIQSFMRLLTKTKIFLWRVSYWTRFTKYLNHERQAEWSQFSSQRTSEAINKKMLLLLEARLAFYYWIKLISILFTQWLHHSVS